MQLIRWVNANKIEILNYHSDSPNEEAVWTVKLENQEPKNSFKNLVSSYDLKSKMQNQIRLDTTSFGRLKDQVFLNQDMITSTKVDAYKTISLFTFMAVRPKSSTRFKSGDWRHLICTASCEFLESWCDCTPRATILIMWTSVLSTWSSFVSSDVSVVSSRSSLDSWGIVLGQSKGRRKWVKDQLKATLILCSVNRQIKQILAADWQGWCDIIY